MSETLERTELAVLPNQAAANSLVVAARIIEELVVAAGITEDNAIAVVTAIARGEIPHIAITY